MKNTNRKILVCAAGDGWLEQVVCQLRRSGITAAPCAAPEELWEVSEECSGILISLEEIISIRSWFQVEKVFENENQEKTFSTNKLHREEESMAELRNLDVPDLLLKKLCQIQEAPVFVVVPERDDLTEYCCLLAGVAECIPTGQFVPLAVERIRRHFVENVDGRGKVLRWKHVILEMEKRQFQAGMVTGCLSATECTVLAVLLNAEGEIVSRYALAETLWGRDGNSHHRNLDAVIRALRGHIRGTGIEIVTCYGRGYYLREIST